MMTDLEALRLACDAAAEERERLDSTALFSSLVRIYNAGYKAGHHDTVEGGYVDVFECDMETYHEEIVREIIEANS